jgi:hypothetical protein
MELINPQLLIRNLDGPHWLVTFDHAFSETEHLALTVKVLKSDHPLGLLQREEFERCQELLQIAVGNMRYSRQAAARCPSATSRR